MQKNLKKVLTCFTKFALMHLSTDGKQEQAGFSSADKPITGNVHTRLPRVTPLERYKAINFLSYGVNKGKPKGQKNLKKSIDPVSKICYKHIHRRTASKGKPIDPPIHADKVSLEVRMMNHTKQAGIRES